MNSGPPIVGWEAQLILFAFLVVMLVVPWLLARDADRRRSAQSMPTSSVFGSTRERNLWLWTLVVVLAIYATLSPAQAMAAALRERGWLGPLTWGVFVGVGLVIAARWIKTRPKTPEIGVAFGVAAVYVTTMIRLPVPEARSHLFEYGLVAMLTYQALEERKRSGRAVAPPALAAVLFTALVGWLDEVVQAFLPTRVYDVRDVAFNAFAAALAVGASVLVAWARRRRASTRPDVSATRGRR